MLDRDFFKLVVACAIAGGHTPEAAIEIAQRAMELDKFYWMADESDTD